MKTIYALKVHSYIISHLNITLLDTLKALTEYMNTQGRRLVISAKHSKQGFCFLRGG